jgi:hypothetical protein
MANYHSIKNAGMLKPVANTDLGSPTITTAGGYRTYKFTSPGSITF